MQPFHMHWFLCSGQLGKHSRFSFYCWRQVEQTRKDWTNTEGISLCLDQGLQTPTPHQQEGRAIWNFDENNVECFVIDTNIQMYRDIQLFFSCCESGELRLVLTFIKHCNICWLAISQKLSVTKFWWILSLLRMK